MASQVLSGAANASYTNNTGQNVRLIINYMQNVTSMTWAGVSVSAESTTIGKDIQNITGEFRSAVTGNEIYNSDIKRAYELKLSSEKTVLGYIPNNPGGVGPTTLTSIKNAVSSSTSFLKRLILFSNSGDTFANAPATYNLSMFQTRGTADSLERQFVGANIFYVPQTISRGGNFPVELMLAPNQSFSAVCGAFNAVVIKEDGT